MTTFPDFAPITLDGYEPRLAQHVIDTFSEADSEVCALTISFFCALSYTDAELNLN